MMDINFKKICALLDYMGEEGAYASLPYPQLEGTWNNKGKGTLEMIDDNFQYLCDLSVVKPHLPGGVVNSQTEGTWDNPGKGTLEMIDENFAEVMEVLKSIPPAISSMTLQLVPVYLFDGHAGGELVDDIKYCVGCETTMKLDSSDRTTIAAKVEAHAKYKSEAGFDAKMPEIGGATAKSGVEIGGSLQASYENVKSAMTSTTSTTYEKRERNLKFTYDFKEPLYLYQAKSTTALRDGSSVSFFGETLVQSAKPLGNVTVVL